MPTLTLSCAVSADGYLDDRSAESAVLSSPEDLARVLRLRAEMDMIVVGAETVRRDDPSLATRGARNIRRRATRGRAPDPVKLVLSASGELPHNRQIWTSGTAETVVLSRAPSDAPATNILFDEDPVDAVLGVATATGCEDILVEGGAAVLRLALPRARWWRLAVSPHMLGATGHARLLEDVPAALEDLHIVYSEDFGDTAVYHVDLHLTRARPLMAQAIALSRRCPPSETAFAVGCLGCDAQMQPLASGYSRETGSTDHAEEAMLSKLGERERARLHTVVCTLEPCLHRASKPTGCAERLVRAGVRRVIYAVAEDRTFTDQSGLAFLAENGVEVIRLPGFESGFRSANAALYASA